MMFGDSPVWFIALTLAVAGAVGVLYLIPLGFRWLWNAFADDYARDLDDLYEGRR